MRNADETSSDVDTRLLDERIDHAFDRRSERGGGDDGSGSDFETRLRNVESKVDDMRIVLERVETKIDMLPKSADVAEIKGRVSQLPTVWQLFGLVLGIFALAFAQMRFGIPQI